MQQAEKSCVESWHFFKTQSAESTKLFAICWGQNSITTHREGTREFPRCRPLAWRRWGISRAPDAMGFPVGWLSSDKDTIRYTEFTPLDFWVNLFSGKPFFFAESAEHRQVWVYYGIPALSHAQRCTEIMPHRFQVSVYFSYRVLYRFIVGHDCTPQHFWSDQFLMLIQRHQYCSRTRLISFMCRKLDESNRSEQKQICDSQCSWIFWKCRC